jgi:hypothetical protein
MLEYISYMARVRCALSLTILKSDGVPLSHMQDFLAERNKRDIENQTEG